MPPQLIFGTASFGMDMTDFQDKEAVNTLLKTIRDLDIARLDTGARYPPLNPGLSETLIGTTRASSEAFLVDTKVFTDTRTDGSGDLKREAIEKSVVGSLERLQRPEGVNVLYAHRADPATPLEEQIQGFNEQIAQGRCKNWGVSNTPPDVLEKIVQLCDKHGWRKPRCYQGDYNIITRAMEDKLLPTLRAHGISYMAFRPFAAGFLTGSFLNNQYAGTRFDEKNPLGPAIQKMFGAEELHLALKEFDVKVKAEGLTLLEVAIRWLVYHSALTDDDGIILGASKATQVIEAVSLARKGPLPNSVQPLVNSLWDAVRPIRTDII
ncbi:putative oxidoreductase [Phaeosphaeriaceae sp. SRC1lsM3a]|nr:putative oxidoreductase [Stagonospora sp. SRC1lsM3a]